MPIPRSCENGFRWGVVVYVDRVIGLSVGSAVCKTGTVLRPLVRRWDFCSCFCKALRIPLVTIRLSVMSVFSITLGNVFEGGAQARYGLINKCCNCNNQLHTEDDLLFRP